MDYLLSRHPIYKSKIDVAGYEIRARLVNEQTGGPPAPKGAERSVYTMLTDDGLAQIAGEHACYVNLTPEALTQGWWKQIPANKVVLGYFEDFNADDEVGREILKVVDRGGRIALGGNLGPETLSKFADRIHALKFEVTAFTPEDLKQKAEDLKRYSSHLLAGSVDTYDDLEYCKDIGFDLYQGRFISRIATKEERDIPVNKLTMMRVLSKLQDPEITMPDLEKAISVDAALSYKLLTFANSAAVSLPRTVSSVGHAARMVGVNLLRTWASLLLLSSVDDKPRELMTIALVRARMCERLGGTLKNAQKESFFSTGLLSVIDALLDCPMDKALSRLPLIDEVKAALSRREGQAGQALRCSVAYEQADWDEVQFYGLSPALIRDTYMEAIGWARQLTAGLLPA